MCTRWGVPSSLGKSGFTVILHPILGWHRPHLVPNFMCKFLVSGNIHIYIFKFFRSPTSRMFFFFMKFGGVDPSWRSSPPNFIQKFQLFTPSKVELCLLIKEQKPVPAPCCMYVWMNIYMCRYIGLRLTPQSPMLSLSFSLASTLCILHGLIIRTEQSAKVINLLKLYGVGPKLLGPHPRFVL